MSGDQDLGLFLHAYKLEALEHALRREGITPLAYLQEQVERAYVEKVPEEARQAVQQRIAQEAAQAEAARCFAVFHVRERGEEEWFLVEDRLEFLAAATHLRNYIQRSSGQPEQHFSGWFARRVSLTPEAFETYVMEPLENTGRVAGAFDIDLDQGVCSGLSILDGWRAYSIKDICAAAFQAGRKQDLSPSARLTRFLDRLEGREITPPPGPFPGVELEEGEDIPISQSWMEGP